MTKVYRIGLAMIGMMAVLATAAFVKVAILPRFDADSAQDVKRTRPVVVDAAAEPAAAPAAEPAAEPTPRAPLVFDHPESSPVADAAVPNVPVYGSPGAASPTKTLKNPTIEGVPLIFAVKERQGDWIKVQLPVRPNGATGWVKASDVKTRSVNTHIVVQVAERRLSAFRGSKLLMEAPVGVGKAKSPTPTGTFYVDISVKNPGQGYGRHLLSVAGFSNVLKNFGGGVGQIAIHGTSNLGTVGQFSSNGCLRLTNDDVVRLAGMVQTGSPVFILP